MTGGMVHPDDIQVTGLPDRPRPVPPPPGSSGQHRPVGAPHAECDCAECDLSGAETGENTYGIYCDTCQDPDLLDEFDGMITYTTPWPCEQASEPPAGLALHDWSHTARVRITHQQFSTNALQDRRVFAAGEELVMLQWGRAGQERDDMWWTSRNADDAQCVTSDCVEVLETIARRGDPE
jgi:hypothetical protein